MNNRTWKEISKPSAGTPGDNMYVLRKVMNARFIRINGSAQYTDPTYFGFYYIKFYGSLSPVSDVSCMRRKRIDAIAFQMIFLVASKMF